MTPAFDPIGMIRVLSEHKVRFVVIGGVAAGVQGAAWFTRDLDICYARNRSDHKRLADALAALDARPRRLPAGVNVTLDARALSAGDIWTLETRFGWLDCLGSPAPGMTYETLVLSARRMEGEESYLVASVDDLIEMKLVAGRPKDLIGVELLRALREEMAAYSTGSQLMNMSDADVAAWLESSGLKTVTTAGLAPSDGAKHAASPNTSRR